MSLVLASRRELLPRPGELDSAGLTPDGVRQLLARYGRVHFKDAVRPFTRPDFLPNLRELGRGEVDFPALMRTLERLRYRGWINVEQDFTSTSPRASCRASMQYVRDVLRKVCA